MQKIKKIVCLLVLMICVCLLTGWGSKTVELLNDTHLIDLNKAIKEVPIGKQGNIQRSEEEETVKEDNSNKESTESYDVKETSYIISIRDTTITYNNEICNEIDVLKNKIRDDCSNGNASIELKDDYAEAHVYNEVLTMLKQLYEEEKIKYRSE